MYSLFFMECELHELTRSLAKAGWALQSLLPLRPRLLTGHIFL